MVMDGLLRYCLKTVEEIATIATAKNVCVAIIKPRRITVFRKDNGRLIQVFEYISGFRSAHNSRISKTHKHLRRQFKPPRIEVEIVGCCISHNDVASIFLYSNDASITKWEVKHGNVRCCLRYYGHTGTVVDIALNKESNAIFSVGNDGMLIKHDAKKSGVMAVARLDSVFVGVESIKDNKIVTSSNDGTVWLWSCDSDRFLQLAKLCINPGSSLNMRIISKASDYYLAIVSQDKNFQNVCNIFDLTPLGQETGLFFSNTETDDFVDDIKAPEIFGENQKCISIRDTYDDEIYIGTDTYNNQVRGAVSLRPSEKPIKSIHISGRKICQVSFTQCLHVVLALDDGSIEVWNPNLTNHNKFYQSQVIGDKNIPVLVYRIKFPEKNVLGLCTARSSESSFSLLIYFKKQLAMVQLKHEYTKNVKMHALPKDMKLSPKPSRNERDTNQVAHRGKVYLGLTQRSFVPTEPSKYQLFERVERQKGGAIRRPRKKASLTYTRSPRKIRYRNHLRYFSDNRSYMEQPSVVIFSKSNELDDRTIEPDKTSLMEEVNSSLYSQTSKLTHDILSYSSDIVMTKNGSRNPGIHEKRKQSNSLASSSASNPLFPISATVTKGTGVNGMDIVWDEVDERKTTRDRIEERHQRFFHNVVKKRLHNNIDKAVSM